MSDAVILSAARTPVGKFLGALKSLKAVDLGVIAARAAIERAGIEPELIDEVIMGNVVQAGNGQNPARQVALKAGVPNKVAALTVNKVCGSGLKSVMLASQGIRLGEIDAAIAGGMESMTNAPYLLNQAREGYRLGNGQLIDSVIHDGLWCAFDDWHMGSTGEIIAEKYKVDRQEQDEFAAGSHRKAVAAQREGRFDKEIVAVEIPQKKGEALLIKTDEGPRADTSVELLSRLKPAFKEGGTVTAGNASAINDGAAALVVTSEDVALKLGRKPMARIIAQATSGVEPRMVMMAPVTAIQKVLERARWALSEVDLIEINEAFSVQIVAITREMGIDPSRLNVNGGAVALGHPIGASGARVLVTLLHEMERRDARRGIAALCLGGGNAVALAVER
ncbi:MAG: acetyl-CoA C-acyltransferase [Blastocatellia bacterium AA13]|nr:MAG: acetyl-CoA C-acyltransferase [Blastocatellia bacterium AA13]